MLQTRICLWIFRRWPPTLTIFFSFFLLVGIFGIQYSLWSKRGDFDNPSGQRLYYCFDWWNNHVDLKLCRLFACSIYFFVPFLARILSTINRLNIGGSCISPHTNASMPLSLLFNWPGDGTCMIFDEPNTSSTIHFVDFIQQPCDLHDDCHHIGSIAIGHL